LTLEDSIVYSSKEKGMDLKFQTAEQVMKMSNTPNEVDFECNRNSGFSMNINGYRISIQFGPGNYISDMDIRRKMDDYEPLNFRMFGTDDAEVMIWGRDNGTMFNIAPHTIDTDEGLDEFYAAQGGHMDQVFGHCSSDCVARMIGCLASCGDEDPRRSIVQIYNASKK